MFLRDIPYIAEDLSYLRAHDPVFAPLHIPDTALPWTVYEDGFTGLVRIILAQQISAKVAETLWARFKMHINESTVTAEEFLSYNAKTLKPFGFTRQKADYALTLARSIHDGTFDIQALNTMNDVDLTKKLVELRGFGLWSAQIYLIFSLTRRNVLPKGDLGLDRAMQSLFNLETRPTYTELQHHSKEWDGRYTAATLLLWAIYVQKIKY